MPKILVVVLGLLLIPIIGDADEWTKGDTAREATYLTLRVIDWGQTRNIVHREAEGYSETNKILGKHPTINEVDAYMAGAALGHILIAAALPRKWREGFQYVTILELVIAVVHNNSISLKVDFE